MAAAGFQTIPDVPTVKDFPVPDIAYKKLTVTTDRGVATVSIDNPPVNVLDAALMAELRHFLLSARSDGGPEVIVFESANPDFFIAHVDMALIDQPTAFDAIAREIPAGLNVFQALGELLRTQPQVTIVKLAGLARGGGAEFVAAVDMVFAASETAGLAQCEALMGIVPSGGGMQYLNQRVGRNRMLEVVLGADLFDAATAERYGWINRALPTAELDAFVDRLAHHIADLPPGVVAAVKSSMPPADFSEGFRREEQAWGGLFARPAAEALIRGGLNAGAQTSEGERDLETLLRTLSKSHVDPAKSAA